MLSDPYVASSEYVRPEDLLDMSTANAINGNSAGSRRQTSGASDDSPAQSPSSNDNRNGSPSLSANKKDRLTEDEKKKNHINSEQKRREAIRRGFDELTQIVPGTQGQARSENIVLEATITYIEQQIAERRKLLALAEANGIPTAQFQLPPGLGRERRDSDNNGDVSQ